MGVCIQGPTKEIDIKFPIPEAARKLGFVEESAAEAVVDIPEYLKKVHSAIASGLIAGFQLATAAGHSFIPQKPPLKNFSTGPLCDEPMWGVAFEIDIRLKLPITVGNPRSEPDLGEDVYGPFNGQVSPSLKKLWEWAAR